MNNTNFRPTIEEARALLYASDPEDGWTLELAAAADTLMKACEDSERVSLGDLLRCLDFTGFIAEFGARGLYVRTGRDGVGWRPANSGASPFSTSKSDWQNYLSSQNLLLDE